MRDIIENKEIKVNERNIIPLAEVKEESDVTLNLELYKNNMPFDVTGQSIKLGLLINNELIGEQSDGITINKNVVTIKLKNSFIQPGKLELDLTLTDNTGRMTTSSFYLIVNKKTIGGTSIQGTDLLETLDKVILYFKVNSQKAIDGFIAESTELLSNIKKNGEKTINDIKSNYDSLKQIIIDENQAANLQEQINVNKNKIEQLEDLTPVWQEHSGAGNITVNDSFDGLAKDLIVKGITLQNLMNNYSFIKSKDSKAIYLYLNDETLANFTFKNITNKTLNIQFSNPDGSYKRQVTLSPGQYITSKGSTEKFRQLRGEFEFGWENDSINYEQLLKNILINGEVINLPNMYFDSIASVGEKEDNKIKIKSIGKNLFVGENIKIINNTSAVEKFHFEDISYLQEGSYFISYKKIGNGGSEIYLKIGDKYTQILVNSLSGRFSIPNTNEKIELRFDCNGAYTEIRYFDIQIEKGSVATNYEQYRAKLIEIQLPFEGGLKSLPNGICDEIYDNGKIIQKIEKRVYKSGDELLPNAITDKKNTIIELSEYKTYDINPFFLRTFNETTHLYQENNICGEISFETAKDRDAIINGNTEAISNFDKTSIKLQKELTFIKNEILEMEQDISKIKTNIGDLSEKEAICAREISGIKEINNQISQKMNENKNEITSLKTVINESELNFDITNSEPVYITQCETFKTTVAQGLGYDNVNQEFYMSQVYVNESWGSETEHFVINRCDIHGKLIDSMRCRNGGHGTIFGLERDNRGVIWIWTAWKSASGYELKNTNNVVRIKYKSGDIDLKSYGEWSYINTFNNNVYTNVVLSADGDEIAFITDSTITNKLNVKIRKKADVLNATDRIINNIELDNKNSWQSFAFDEKYYYYRTGLASEIDKIHKIDRVSSVMTIIKPNTGKPINNFKEAEGMCFASSLDNKLKTLLLVTVKDVELRRANQIWCYPHGEIGTQLIGSQSNKLKQFKDNGRCFQPPLNITKMSEITESGWYYFDSNAFSKMLDKPQIPSTGGWLNVSPKNDNGERFVQEFIANNVGSFTQKGFFKVSRVIDIKNPNNIVVWHGTSQEVTLWSSDSNPQLNVSVNLSDNWKNFDYLYLKYKCPSGDNSGDQLLSTKYLTGRTITNTLLNLGDSDNVAEFYEHKLELSEDGMSFIPQRRVSTKGNTEAFSIKRIVGVRL